MRRAKVFVQEQFAGILEELEGGKYSFTYDHEYSGSPVSLTMPVSKSIYVYSQFPPFFEGLLPEGLQLESLLRREKIDKSNYLSQLLIVGEDLVGDVTVKEIK